MSSKIGSDLFIDRHLGLGDNDEKIMLKKLGFHNIDQFINQVIPEDIRLKEKSSEILPQGCSVIEALNEKDQANLIYKYGDERLSRKIARKIKLDLKENGKYSGTKELAYSIAGCFPPKQRYKKIHPATRTFQALRIAVNKEIEVLEKFLQVVPEWLLPGGIISIISFHSLEDRLVKNSFKNDQRLKNLTKKPITPSEQEVELNKRARSGKLRIAQLY